MNGIEFIVRAARAGGRRFRYPADDDEKFDSDMVLMTGELAKLLAELVDALGGEQRT